MRTIGLIGGMSWQSSRLYYDRINQMVADRLGGAHSARIIINSLDFGPIAKMQTAGEWREAGAVLANAAQSLERAGADVIAIGANTMHKMAQQVMASVRLPLIHIGDALAKELKADARSRPLLLGTRYTMEDPFLIDHLGNKGVGAGLNAVWITRKGERLGGVDPEAAFAEMKNVEVDDFTAATGFAGDPFQAAAATKPSGAAASDDF